MVNDPWNSLKWILTKCQLLPGLSSWECIEKALIVLYMVRFKPCSYKTFLLDTLFGAGCAVAVHLDRCGEL